jgi:hypothetical protein
MKISLLAVFSAALLLCVATGSYAQGRGNGNGGGGGRPATAGPPSGVAAVESKSRTRNGIDQLERTLRHRAGYRFDTIERTFHHRALTGQG